MFAKMQKYFKARNATTKKDEKTEVNSFIAMTSPDMEDVNIINMISDSASSDSGVVRNLKTTLPTLVIAVKEEPIPIVRSEDSLLPASTFSGASSEDGEKDTYDALSDDFFNRWSSYSYCSSSSALSSASSSDVSIISRPVNGLHTLPLRCDAAIRGSPSPDDTPLMPSWNAPQTAYPAARVALSEVTAYSASATLCATPIGLTATILHPSASPCSGGREIGGMGPMKGYGESASCCRARRRKARSPTSISAAKASRRKGRHMFNDGIPPSAVKTDASRKRYGMDVPLALGLPLSISGDFIAPPSGRQGFIDDILPMAEYEATDMASGIPDECSASLATSVSEQMVSRRMTDGLGIVDDRAPSPSVSRHAFSIGTPAPHGTALRYCVAPTTPKRLNVLSIASCWARKTLQGLTKLFTRFSLTA